jgi:hypothetical protein
MWSLDNRTPYGVQRNWTRDKQGVHLWIVAVKATFDVTGDGKVSLADEQSPPNLAPEHHGKPGVSSLRYDSDLLGIKPCTDVVADACAHAPNGRAAPVVSVSLRVGDLHKQLVVHGERVYYEGGNGLAMTQPSPFESQPIRYESAYGGADLDDPDPARRRLDERNPVGRGVAIVESKLVGQPAHSIEYPEGQAARVRPAGFGPIDAAWMPRRALAGTYDAAWERTKKPLLADDYQELYASCAPIDQRPAAHLRGGERVELVNLTKDGILRFDLPKIYPTFSTAVGRRTEEHRPRLTSLILEAEALRFALVWQTAIQVEASRAEYLDQTTIREKRYL